MSHHQSGFRAQTSMLNLGTDAPSSPKTHTDPLLDPGGLGLCQVDILRSAPLRNPGPQVNLGADRAAGIEHVANLQQGQLGHSKKGGMGGGTATSRHVQACARLRMQRGSSGGIGLGRDAARRVAIKGSLSGSDGDLGRSCECRLRASRSAYQQARLGVQTIISLRVRVNQIEANSPTLSNH
jgi:hypothetical protein